MARGSGGLTAERLRDLARSGAENMLKQLRAEIIAIERTFPELAIPQKRLAVREALQKVRRRVRTMRGKSSDSPRGAEGAARLSVASLRLSPEVHQRARPDGAGAACC